MDRIKEISLKGVKVTKEEFHKLLKDNRLIGISVSKKKANVDHGGCYFCGKKIKKGTIYGSISSGYPFGPYHNYDICCECTNEILNDKDYNLKEQRNMSEEKFYNPLRQTDVYEEISTLQWNVIQAVTLFHNKCLYRFNRKTIMESLEKANKNLNAISEFVNFFRGYMTSMDTKELDAIEDKYDKEWLEKVKDIQIPEEIKNIRKCIDLDNDFTGFHNNSDEKEDK